MAEQQAVEGVAAGEGSADAVVLQVGWLRALLVGVPAARRVVVDGGDALVRRRRDDARRNGIQMKTAASAQGVSPLLTRGHPLEVRAIERLWQQASASSSLIHRAPEHAGD